MNRETRWDALYRFDNLIGKLGRTQQRSIRSSRWLPFTRCRCLILAVNGLSFMFSHE
jgi:hypothetical protein